MNDRAKAIVDAHVLITRGKEILLLLRKNTGYEDGKYCLVAGHLEASESITSAAIREAAEEVGISIKEPALQFSHVMHNNSGGHRIGFFFTVKEWDGDPHNLEPEKCVEVRWFPIDKLPDNIILYQLEAIRKISENLPFSCHGWI